MTKILFIVFVSFCFSANAQQATKQEAFDYIRGKLISLSTRDGNNGINEVTFDDNSNTMTIIYENKSSDVILFRNLDANAVGWDIFNPNNNGGSGFDKLVRLTVASKGSGLWARVNYDRNNQTTDLPRSFTRFFFSLSKAADIPNFQDKIASAVKRLITLCGGMPERNVF